MNRATPKMRYFPERLIAFETTQSISSKTKAQASFRVSEKLRPHLSTFLGNAGFHALLMRALALASAEAPWLRAVHVNAEGSLEGWDELERGAQGDPQQIAEGRIVLLAQLLGLLVAFIGESLTLRLVHEEWPKLPLAANELFSANDLDFVQEKNEKQN